MWVGAACRSINLKGEALGSFLGVPFPEEAGKARGLFMCVLSGLRYKPTTLAAGGLVS